MSHVTARDFAMSSYTIPSVIESSPRGERVTDIYSRLLSERIIFLGTPIDDGVSNVVVAQILHLASAAPEQDIQLYINSPGGSFSSMMAIYDTMAFVASDVATLCVGQSSSVAAMLVAAGTPGKRALLPHARVVLSQPHTEGASGSLSDLALEAEELAFIRAEGDRLLSKHTGRDVDRIRFDTDRALVLRGAAAVEYGLVDHVLERPESGGQRERGMPASTVAALHPDAGADPED